jgi:hypothetical protein
MAPTSGGLGEWAEIGAVLFGERLRLYYERDFQRYKNLLDKPNCG